MAEQNERPEVIKASQNNEYLLFKYNDRYYVADNTGDEQKVVSSPGGNLLGTSYLSLAERIFADIQKYGIQCMSPESILPWHYTMIDNFSRMDHSEVESMLDQCFLQCQDWTFDDNQDDDDWTVVFGEEDERKATIREWLSNCTHMQMTAACCIGNAYHSINIAFVLARLMENFDGNKLNQRFKSLAGLIANNSIYGPAEDIIGVFKTFELYYGIHLEEEGSIIHEKIEDKDEVDAYTGKKITVEALIGRNFYLFSDAVKSNDQPFELDLSDLDLDTDDEEDEVEDKDEDDEEEVAEEYNELEDYLSDSCWVKRICAVEDGYEAYHIIAVTIDNMGIIDCVTVILEEVRRSGGGWFMIPGMELPGSSSYEEMDYMPDDVVKELDALIGERYLKKDFSLVGKRLPQAMIDAGGNGGSNTEYTYALQSAYRMAYMHMSVYTDEDGVIEDFSYSTYQSSGSSFGDMFSRPMRYSDRKDEAIEMLLHILDQYTKEEFRNL